MEYAPKTIVAAVKTKMPYSKNFISVLVISDPLSIRFTLFAFPVRLLVVLLANIGVYPRIANQKVVSNKYNN